MAAIQTAERPIEERFESAVAVVRSLPKDGPFQPSDMVKLKFYGLYKQAKEGPNKTPKPGFWDPTARAKWEAWTLCGNMTKEQSMKMYVSELQQMVETMPQSKEVEDFIKSIGPFYEFVEDEDQAKETELNEQSRTDEQNDKDKQAKAVKPTKQVTFETDVPHTSNDDQDDDDDDDDGELEFQDSYDNLPTSTPPSSSHSIIKRRPTPYIPKFGLPLGQQRSSSEDPLSTNLFRSPSLQSSNHSELHVSPGISGEQSSAMEDKVVQLLQSVQVLIQQFNQFFQENNARSTLWRRQKKVLIIVAPIAINIVIRYWISNYSIVPDWMWFLVTTCHVVFNICTCI